MRPLRCTTIQLDIAWHQPEVNRAKVSSLLEEHQKETDLIILPEMFTTGFTMDSATYAESMEGSSMQWMSEQSDLYNAVICGSLIIKEGDHYFNRFVWMFPGGMYHTYDKRHLFAMADEHKVYTPGEEKVIINYKGWNICPQICYDLRFPVWSRNEGDYDILIYVANWPEKRAHHWRSLIQARAIENQAYVIGVNRFGTDANGHAYIGDTCIADPRADQFIYHHSGSEQVHTSELSVDELSNVREKLPFLADRDNYKIL